MIRRDRIFGHPDVSGSGRIVEAQLRGLPPAPEIEFDLPGKVQSAAMGGDQRAQGAVESTEADDVQPVAIAGAAAEPQMGVAHAARVLDPHVGKGKARGRGVGAERAGRSICATVRA